MRIKTIASIISIIFISYTANANEWSESKQKLYNDIEILITKPANPTIDLKSIVGKYKHTDIASILSIKSKSDTEVEIELVLKKGSCEFAGIALVSGNRLLDISLESVKNDITLMDDEDLNQLIMRVSADKVAEEFLSFSLLRTENPYLLATVLVDGSIEVNSANSGYICGNQGYLDGTYKKLF